MRTALFTILSILVGDQWLKLWVKLNFIYGESRELIPGWFELRFVENPGMAFGWMIPGDAGKLTLSLFRIVVVGFILVYLLRLIRQNAHTGLVFSISLIVAGALGNIVDSACYGLLFNKGSLFDPDLGEYTVYFGKAAMEGPGYAPFLMGNVVDMFHITREITIGGRSTELFSPVFNLADAAITCGIISILIFQRRFFKSSSDEAAAPPDSVNADGPVRVDESAPA